MRLSLLLLLAAAVLPAAPPPLRVVTCNVRFPSPNDGADRWEQRRELLLETLRETGADLIGTQELFLIQGEYLADHLPGFSWLGRSRRGNDQDEHMGILYREDRLRLVEQGDFWLSETPQVVGSQSWGTTLPRMVTWALFEDIGSKRRFYHLNTHLAHRAVDEPARRKSAEVIVQFLKTLPAGTPVVLTGDFNTNAGGPVEAVLTAAGLQDTRGLAPAAARLGPEGTFHGFQGTPRGDRIDWVLVSKEWKVLRNEAVTKNYGGRYPSDHLPVAVTLAEVPARAAR